MYPQLRGLHVERAPQQRLAGSDDLTHHLTGTSLPRKRRRICNFPPPAAKLDLGGTDDPYGVVNSRREQEHGVALNLPLRTTNLYSVSERTHARHGTPIDKRATGNLEKTTRSPSLT